MYLYIEARTTQLAHDRSTCTDNAYDYILLVTHTVNTSVCIINE